MAVDFDGPAAPADEAPFGALLRRHRRAAGLTQEQLAARAGLSARGVQDLERGARATPQRETVRKLAAALGLSPEAAAVLGATVSRVRRPSPGGGRAAGPEVAAPGRPARVPARGRLPRPLDSFVGRERELTAVRERLLDPDVRLLTLTGPGGVGKTRLALHAAAASLDGYPDGAWFVPLAPLGDPALVAAAVAGVLGVRESGRETQTEALAASLRDRRLLLVLDNCEHLLPAAPLVADLLASCPGLTVLATSRAPLRLSGEHQLAVPPLSLPEPEPQPTVAGILHFEAPALFVQRAVAAQADFAVTPENAPAVAEVCRRLDGLPLALELAAARVKLLPPRALLARLDRRLMVLTGGPRDAPARQRTLRATLDWSHGLLAPPEQALFRRLAVFAGGCDLDAAGAVCDADGDSSTGALDGIASLVDLSLLGQTQGRDGEPRFWMLETVREFALERLATSAEAATIRRAHARFYLALAEAGKGGLQGPEQAVWLDRLETEHPNLRAALEWHLEEGDADSASRLAAALGPFWHLRRHVAEGRTWLDRVVALGGEASPTRRGEALLAAAQLAVAMGDYDAAPPFLEESLALHRTAGDRRGEATVLDALGSVAHYQADFARAFSSFEESLALVRTLRDRAGVARTLNSLGHAAWHIQQLATARGYLSESLAIWRELGNGFEVGNVLWSLGLVARDEGDPAGARAAFAEGIATLQSVAGHRLITMMLDGLASLTVTTGEPAQAVRLMGAANAWRTSTGYFDPLPFVYRRDFYDGLMAAAHAALDGEAFAAAWAAGRALPLEAAIAEALQRAPSPSPAPPSPPS
jgi:predicted ATPase/transcriptional regulator with XRE-family HTH domain